DAREGERAPDGRVLEERVVEEAVHANCSEHESADKGREPGEVGRAAAEAERERHVDEPSEQREPDYARLGRDRDRRVVRGAGLRLLRAQVGLLRVGVPEAADSDADDRVVERDLDPVRDEPRAAARYAVDAAVGMVEHRVPDPRANGYSQQ